MIFRAGRGSKPTDFLGKGEGGEDWQREKENFRTPAGGGGGGNVEDGVWGEDKGGWRVKTESGKKRGRSKRTKGGKMTGPGLGWEVV